MEHYKIIIAGGRNFSDYRMLSNCMDTLLASKGVDFEIVCGKARGADTLGERYALERGLSIKYFPAEWDEFGNRAGFIRNELMARYADILVAFWDGKSSGTKNMIELGKRYGLKVYVVRY